MGKNKMQRQNDRWLKARMQAVASPLPKSYVSIVRAEEGLLLGGVKRHESSRFESEQDAISFKDTCLDTNRKAGVKCNGEVILVYRKPEIASAPKGV